MKVDDYITWMSGKIDGLRAIADKYPLNRDAKMEYVNKLMRWENERELLEEVISYFAGDGVWPTPNTFLDEVIKHAKRAEERKRTITRDDRLLCEKKNSPQEVLIGYLALKAFMPTMPRTKDVDNACIEVYGRIFSDEELLVMLPDAQVKIKSVSAN